MPRQTYLLLYPVVGDQRKLVAERPHPTYDGHVGHTQQLIAIGARLEALVDGELQFAAYDDELLRAGKAGVWASPVGGTLFDTITVEAFEESA